MQKYVYASMKSLCFSLLVFFHLDLGKMRGNFELISIHWKFIDEGFVSWMNLFGMKSISFQKVIVKWQNSFTKLISPTVQIPLFLHLYWWIDSSFFNSNRLIVSYRQKNIPTACLFFYWKLIQYSKEKELNEDFMIKTK